MPHDERASPPADEDQVFRLGSLRLDARSGVLHSEDGAQIRPRRKLGQLLLILAQHPGQVLTRARLLDLLWPKTARSDESLSQLVREARVALRDQAGTLLQTVHGRGYILQPAVRQPAGPPATSASSFVGRQQQLDGLRVWLEQHRLVTLTGPGGVGKTRLMAELAAKPGARSWSGPVRLDLAPAVPGVDLTTLLANRIGIGATRDDAVEAVVKALRDRQDLLLIDNAEHMVVSLAALLRWLLAECPGIRVLVTSRVSLSIAEERVFRLAPLSLPRPEVATMADALQHSAVQLLADRATAQAGGFEPASQNPQVMAAICRQLDGLPLAIELAASMLSVLTPEQLLGRLGRRLHLQAPLGGKAPTRQRSLAAMLGWSWELLEPFERNLLQALATFTGSAPLGLLAEVADTKDWQALDGVAVLVRASLATPSPGSEEPRFALLETTRAFALEQAGPWVEVLRRRHFDAILRSLQTADRDWPTTASAEWQLRHGVDAANLRSALHWAFGPGAETDRAIHLVSVAHSFWLELDELPLREARQWLIRAAQLAGPATQIDVLARLDLGLSWPDDQLGDATTLPLALRAAERFRGLGDQIGTGAALWRAGCAVLVVETIDQAGDLLAEAERALRTGQPTKWLVLTLVRQASVRVLKRQDELALATYNEALSLARALGYPYGAMLCGHSAGDHLFAMGRRDEALALLMGLRDELPRGLRSQLVSNLATQLAAVHRDAEAMEAIAEILDSISVTGLSATLARGLETLAMFAAEAGDAECAALLFGHVLTVHPTRRQRNGGRKEVHRRLIAALHAHDPDELILRARLEKGATMSETEITEIARAKLRQMG